MATSLKFILISLLIFGFSLSIFVTQKASAVILRTHHSVIEDVSASRFPKLVLIALRNCTRTALE